VVVRTAAKKLYTTVEMCPYVRHLGTRRSSTVMTEKCQARRMPGTRAPTAKEIRHSTAVATAQVIRTYANDSRFTTHGNRQAKSTVEIATSHTESTHNGHQQSGVRVYGP
jgi:hypothetical protein